MTTEASFRQHTHVFGQFKTRVSSLIEDTQKNLAFESMYGSHLNAVTGLSAAPSRARTRRTVTYMPGVAAGPGSSTPARSRPQSNVKSAAANKLPSMMAVQTSTPPTEREDEQHLRTKHAEDEDIGRRVQEVEQRAAQHADSISQSHEAAKAELIQRTSDSMALLEQKLHSKMNEAIDTMTEQEREHRGTLDRSFNDVSQSLIRRMQQAEDRVAELEEQIRSQSSANRSLQDSTDRLSAHVATTPALTSEELRELRNTIQVIGNQGKQIASLKEQLSEQARVYELNEKREEDQRLLDTQRAFQWEGRFLEAQRMIEELRAIVADSVEKEEAAMDTRNVENEALLQTLKQSMHSEINKSVTAPLEDIRKHARKEGMRLSAVESQLETVTDSLRATDQSLQSLRDAVDAKDEEQESAQVKAALEELKQLSTHVKELTAQEAASQVQLAEIRDRLAAVEAQSKVATRELETRARAEDLNHVKELAVQATTAHESRLNLSEQKLKELETEGKQADATVSAVLARLTAIDGKTAGQENSNEMAGGKRSESLMSRVKELEHQTGRVAALERCVGLSGGSEEKDNTAAQGSVEVGLLPRLNQLERHVRGGITGASNSSAKGLAAYDSTEPSIDTRLAAVQEQLKSLSETVEEHGEKMAVVPSPSMQELNVAVTSDLAERVQRLEGLDALRATYALDTRAKAVEEALRELHKKHHKLAETAHQSHENMNRLLQQVDVVKRGSDAREPQLQGQIDVHGGDGNPAASSNTAIEGIAARVEALEEEMEQLKANQQRVDAKMDHTFAQTMRSGKQVVLEGNRREQLRTHLAAVDDRLAMVEAYLERTSADPEPDAEPNQTHGRSSSNRPVSPQPSWYRLPDANGSAKSTPSNARPTHVNDMHRLPPDTPQDTHSDSRSLVASDRSLPAQDSTASLSQRQQQQQQQQFLSPSQFQQQQGAGTVTVTPAAGSVAASRLKPIHKTSLSAEYSPSFNASNVSQSQISASSAANTPQHHREASGISVNTALPSSEVPFGSPTLAGVQRRQYGFTDSPTVSPVRQKDSVSAAIVEDSNITSVPVGAAASASKDKDSSFRLRLSALPEEQTDEADKSQTSSHFRSSLEDIDQDSHQREPPELPPVHGEDQRDRTATGHESRPQSRATSRQESDAEPTANQDPGLLQDLSLDHLHGNTSGDLDLSLSLGADFSADLDESVSSLPNPAAMTGLSLGGAPVQTQPASQRALQPSAQQQRVEQQPTPSPTRSHSVQSNQNRRQSGGLNSSLDDLSSGFPTLGSP